MITALCAFIVGTGIGAYNTEVLKPCLSQTFHLTKQKAQPMAKHVSTKVAEGAKVASASIQEKVANMRNK
eukprot:CAMPEP_0115210844 /NCGR_PEP_ID=MMETSP0270-20121206/22455_1 /TAXON_ID=71861 /ORGANISM="Scrippsiella trochoidea, Strain CCMP3099" /LENGTH=69 /DNA_ID=CAMNT_0002624509 /DNA_START=107 /DNA_END=316 /DNA_ORIENTATION=-